MTTTFLSDVIAETLHARYCSLGEDCDGPGSPDFTNASLVLAALRGVLREHPDTVSELGIDRVEVLADQRERPLLYACYDFLNTLGRCGIRLDADFPDAEWSAIYEALGEFLYPDQSGLREVQR